MTATAPAAATGINLSWDECGLAGHAIETFACNTSSTTTRTLIGSFQPPSGIQEFLGLSATMRIAANHLPNYWAMGEGQCRASAINTDFRFTSNGACTDFYNREAVGGFLYETGGFGANTAKLRIQCAVPIDKRGPIDPSKQYYGFKVLITDGNVGTCPGCNEPVRITLEDIQLFQPPERANDPKITQPLDRAVAFWQAEVGGLPQITSFDPSGGTAGDVVSIRGSRLDGATAVRFGGLAATFTVESVSLVRATVPAGVHAGTIEVDTPFGTAATATSFIAAPVIESFLPGTAPAGSDLSVRGYNFSNVSSVKIGDIAAGFIVESDTRLRVTVPPAANGPIAARNAGGSGTSAATFHLGVTEGQLDLAWNDCGRAGDEIMNFACDRSNGAPFTLVASMAPPSNVTSLNGMIADIGVYATQLPDFWKHGTAQCRGTNGLALAFSLDGSTGSCMNFWQRGVYGIIAYDLGFYGENTARIRLTSTMPGGVALDTRTEYNAFRLNVTPVRAEACAGCDVPVRLVLHQMQILQPAGLAYDPVITQPFHRNTALWQGTPGPLPVIQSFTPGFGAGGAPIDIDGEHFTGATAVRIGSLDVASFSVVSDARIHAVAPAGVRSGRISVRTPFGVANSAATFIAPPVVQSFSPGQAPVGYEIQISGYNLTGVTGVKFGNVAATFTGTSDTHVAAHVPEGAPEAPITVTNPAGSSTSEGLFKVGALPIERPVITRFEPLGGAPGDGVSIQGEHFDPVTSVQFGSLEAGFTHTNDSALRAIVPPNARTGFIQLTSLGGIATSESLFVVRPVVQSISPVAGPIGTPVEIHGVNFTRTDRVTLGDKPAAFQLVDDTLIRTEVPIGGATGNFRVTNRGGTGSSPETFTIQSDTPGLLNLSWDYCGAEGDEDETFTCDINDPSRFAFIGSFVAPSRITQFLGASAEVRLESKSDQLPDWWKFGAGTCRGSVLSVDFNFTDEEPFCADPTLGRAAGGFVYEIGRNGPNSARLRIQFAIPFDDRMPLDAGREYYAFKVRIPRTKSVGDGSCEGCSTPVNIEFREIQLFQPPELANDPVITEPALRNKIRWQPAHVGPNLVTDPSFETSIGKWSPVGGATLAQVQPGLVGQSALKVTGPVTPGEFGINDAPNLVPDVPAANRTYRFSVYVRTPTPGMSIQLRAREYQDRVRIQTATSEWFQPEGAWRHLQSQVTSLAAHSTLDFQIICLGGSNAELWVDDVEVNLLGSEPSVRVTPSQISVNPGQPVEIEVTASDPTIATIQSLVADLGGLPVLRDAVFTVDPDNRRGVLRWTPRPEDGGWTYTVPFTATSVLDKTRAVEIEVLGGTPTVFPPDASFEQGLTGWTNYSTSTLERIHGGRIGDWMVKSHQDVRTDEFGLNDHPNWITNTTAAGARYRFSAWVHGSEGTGRARIRVREFLGPTKVGISTYSRDVVLQDRWQQVAVDHVAGVAGSTLDFQVLCVPNADGTTFWIDDVAIRSVDAAAPSLLAGVDVSEATFARPTVFPNPFRKRAMLGLTLSRPGPLRVALFDLSGRRVRMVFDAHAPVGTHQFELDGADDQGRRLGAGMYFYRVDGADGAKQGRFVILE